MTNKKFTDVEIIKMLTRAGRDLTLSDSDKGEIKANLMTVIKSAPNRIDNRGQKEIFNSRRLTMPMIPVMIAVLIALGGGTAALADTAKPGDVLYPVDQWVERMQEKLTFSQEVKAGLFARLSEERAEELSALLAVSLENASEDERTRRENHRTQAIAHLALSIEKVEAVRDFLESKAAASTDEKRIQRYKQVMDRMDEIITRRELKIDWIEENLPPQGPSTGQKEIREQIREFMGSQIDVIAELHAKFKAQFNVDDDDTNPSTPYPIHERFESQLSDKWRELERELAQKRAEAARELAEKIAEGEIEIETEVEVGGSAKLPAPTPLDDDDDNDDIIDDQIQ